MKRLLKKNEILKQKNGETMTQMQNLNRSSIDCEIEALP